jgi:hypothetical protein
LASLTRTLPSGEPEEEATVKLTVICSFGCEGSGASDVMLVVVPAGGGWLTVCSTEAELPLKLGFPSYLAVIVRVPVSDGV